MSSSARQEFIESVDAIESACDETAVRAQDATGRILRKGLVVAAYNTLEGFLADRWTELASYANSGHTQYDDLPEQMQQKILERTVVGAREELKRSTMTLQEKKDFSSRVGVSLTAVTSGLKLSDLVGRWQGSNISADEISQLLNLFRVEKPWQAILELTTEFGYPGSSGTGGTLDLRGEFLDFTRMRNQAAHVMAFNITNLQLRTIPTMITRVGFGVDVLLSAAICRLQTGDQGYLMRNEPVTITSLYTSRVVERKKEFALYRLQNSKASKIESDGDALFNSTCSAASPGEIVVRQNLLSQVRDWSIAGAG